MRSLPALALTGVLLFMQTPFNPWLPCPNGQGPVYSTADGRYNCESGGGAALPSGAIVLIASGSCPASYTEETTLDGKTLLGTLAAHADVGSTGGADNITPAGTNSTAAFTPAGTNSTAAFTPSGTVAWPGGVPTFAGASSTVVVNHVHVQNVNTGTTGGSNGYGVDTSTNGSGATAISTANPTGGAASYTPAGTIAWPAGVPTFAGSGGTVPAQTFTGSSGTVPAETFTGNSFDNRSAFARVIFCRKN